MSALTQMEQLAAFVDWEEQNRPESGGRKHIAAWAMEEIYRLQALLLTDTDLEAIQSASELLEGGARLLDHMGDPEDAKESRTLAAALRSIADERKV